IVGLVASELLDFIWSLPTWVRWFTWGVWIVTLSTILIGRVARPLLRRIDWMGLAALVERSQPGLEERLTCAGSLLFGDEVRDGSSALISALADEAAAQIEATDAARVVPLKRSLRGLACCGTLGLIALLPAILKPDPLATLLSRALMPWSHLERVGL